ncbi:FUSC family protein [Telmatobacter bradus]|uniref:FUSC family protein n=1 Tax=Telmatobacter bradus TaxID=474953 RepID=UPI003B428E91
MSSFSAESRALLDMFSQELASTHGRMAGSLRTTLAATIATLLLLILHIPGMMYGVFLIFLVSYETPYLTFKRGLVAISLQCFGAASALCLISVTGDSPLAKVFGIAVCAFIAAFVRSTAVRYIQPLDFAIFAIATFYYFDLGMRVNQAVEMSLWPVAGGVLSVGCKVAIEYIFTRRNPYYDLHREIDARFLALEKIFLLYASNCDTEDLQRQTIQVRNYAFMGQGKMQLLLQEIDERHKADFTREIVPASIPVLARVLDLMAAYAVHHPPGELSIAAREKMNSFGRAIKLMREAEWKQARQQFDSSNTLPSGELVQLENALRTLISFCAAGRNSTEDASDSAERLGLRNQRWLVPDCFSNPEYTLYAFKVSLCATLCNVIYNALAWPGIATAVTTVLVAGLSTSGATNQKLIFRLLGSTLGGVICGLGCIIFVFPYADSALPFLLSIALVTFIAAWVSRSPHFGYIGLQIAFSFYLTVLTDFSAPTQMSPARDRMMGILLAIIVMLLVFRFEKGVDKMQQTFARLLRLQADYLQDSVSDLQDLERQRKAMEFKDQMGHLVKSARGFSELILFEFSSDRAKHTQACEKIEQAMWSSGDLFLSINSWPHGTASANCVRQSQKALENRLRLLAMAMEQKAKSDQPKGNGTELCCEFLLALPPYIENSIAIYQELYMQCSAITAE